MKSGPHTSIRTISTLMGLAFFVQPLPAQSDISGKLNDASELSNKGEYKQSLVILEPLAQSASSESPEMGRVWILLGSVYQDLGRYPEAQRAYQSAISLFKRQRGREREEEVALDNLGSLYLDMGQPEMSKRLRRQALRLAEAAGDHVAMARIYNNLTATTLQQNGVKEARKCLGRAFAEIELAPKISPDDLAAINSNAGWFSAHDHDYEQAAKYYGAALQSWIEQHGMNHQLTGWGFILRGRARVLMGNASQGLEDVKTGLTIIEKAVGTGVPIYFGARLAYADALLAAGSTKEAKTIRSATRRSIDDFMHSTSSVYTISADAFR